MSNINDLWADLQASDKAVRKSQAKSTIQSKDAEWNDILRDMNKPLISDPKPKLRDATPCQVAESFTFVEAPGTAPSPPPASDVSPQGEFTLSLQREINCISEKSMRTRKKALETLHGVMVRGLAAETEHLAAAAANLEDPPEESAACARALEDLGELLAATDDLLKPLLLRLEDTSERCRELALRLLSGIIAKIDHNASKSLLPYIMPVVMERIGAKPVKEDSEDVRLLIAQLLTSLLKTYGPRIGEHADFVLQIIHVNAVDPYPEFRKELMEVAEAVCAAVPSRMIEATDEYKNNRAIYLVQALAPSLNHKHAAVRLRTLEAIEKIFFLKAGMSIDFLIGWADPTIIPVKAFFGKADPRVNFFGSMATDPSVNVRTAFYKVLANWMKNHPDRWDYERRLLPFMLTGVADEHETIATFVYETIEELGAVYEREKEDEFMDNYRYGDDVLGLTEDAILQAVRNLPPPFKARPRIGARVLVRGHTKKFLGALSKELGDWLEHPQIHSVRLLKVTLIYNEQFIAQNLDELLPNLFKVCKDRVVGKDVLECLTILARYVPPRDWFDLALPHVTGDFSTDVNYITRALTGLAALTRGTATSRFHTVAGDLLTLLFQPDILNSAHTPMRIALSEEMLAFVSVCGPDCKEMYARVLPLLLQLPSCMNVEADDFPLLKGRVEAGLETLASKLSFASASELLEENFEALVLPLTDEEVVWSSYAPELYILETVVERCSASVAYHVELLLPTILELLVDTNERDVRSRGLVVLVRVLRNADLVARKSSLDTSALCARVMEIAKTTHASSLLQLSLGAICALAPFCTSARATAFAVDAQGVIDGTDTTGAGTELRCAILDVVEGIVANSPAVFSAADAMVVVEAVLPRLTDSNNAVRLRTLDIISNAVSVDTPKEPYHRMVKALLGAIEDFEDSVQRRLTAVLMRVALVHPDTFVEGCGAMRSHLERMGRADMATYANVAANELD